MKGRMVASSGVQDALFVLIGLETSFSIFSSNQVINVDDKTRKFWIGPILSLM